MIKKSFFHGFTSNFSFFRYIFTKNLPFLFNSWIDTHFLNKWAFWKKLPEVMLSSIIPGAVFPKCHNGKNRCTLLEYGRFGARCAREKPVWKALDSFSWLHSSTFRTCLIYWKNVSNKNKHSKSHTPHTFYAFLHFFMWER